MIFLKSIVIFLSTVILVLCHRDLKTEFHLKHKSNRANDDASDKFLKVKTENGFVLGKKINHMYAFNGIPYAKPPLGELRFEPPQKPYKWRGTWNATFDRSECVQTYYGTLLELANPSGSEDCLYINVYIPQKPNEKALLPVMVWIYGGGFLNGNSSYSLYGPDDLVQQNLIVVTFNYRLGIFGFLSTYDEAAPGNTGLRDMIFALKWVQKNIKGFGGDPTEVTIFGQSAGSASVSLLVASPLSKGLFKKAIMESGTALCPWAFSTTAREAAYQVGNRLDLHTNNSKELVNQLKQVPAKRLQQESISVVVEILFRDPLNGLVFAPVIERVGKSAVISAFAYESLEKGNFNQVPQIIGYNSFEAIGLANLNPLTSLFAALYQFTPSRLVPKDMNANQTQLNMIGQQIQTFYAGSNGSLFLPSDNFLRYLSDTEFVRSVQKTVYLTSNYVPVYFYEFAYTSNINAKGAAHAEEVPYIFNSNLNSTSDRFIRKCLTKLWTNFAKYSNPTPDEDSTCGNATWKPVETSNRSEMYYLNINKTITSGQNPDKESITFWNHLYKTYGNRPFNTY